MEGNLRRYLEENHRDLTLPPNSDEFLLCFLRGSKFDISLAAKKLTRYFKLLHQYKHIYNGCSTSSVERLLRDGVVTVFKERDSKGRIVLPYKQEFLPPTPDWIEVMCVGMFIVTDFLHRISVDTQRIGFVFLVDLHNYTWSHRRHIHPGLVMMMAKFVSQAFPGRIKAYHFVRNPKIFSYFVSLLTPLLSKKIRTRLYFHGESFEKLNQFIEPKYLPKYLGGELANETCGDGDFLSKLVAEDGYYDDLLTFGYNR